MLKEFKEFAMKGNVLDMSIGIVIGAAFGRIVSSFVTDLLMPPLGLLMGGVDFTNKFLTLSGTTFDTLDAARKAGAVTVNYGLFINVVIDFLIVAFAIFLLVKPINRMRRQPEAAPAPPSAKDCPFCLMSVPLKASRCPHCTSELKAAWGVSMMVRTAATAICRQRAIDSPASGTWLGPSGYPCRMHDERIMQGAA